MFTGYHVWEHRLTSFNDQLKPGHTIWEQLADNGYDTGVFSTNPLITDDDYGLNRGFEHTMEYVDRQRFPFESALNPNDFRSTESYDDSAPLIPQYVKACFRGRDTLKSLLNGVSAKLEPGEHFQHSPFLPKGLRQGITDVAAKTVDNFLEWTAGTENEWGACINMMDAHQPYLPLDRYNNWADSSARRIQEETANKDRWQFYSGHTDWWKCETLDGLYDGCIRQIDAAIEQLVSALRQRGQLDNTLVVITSDHGEGFGEQSRLRDGHRVARHRSGAHEVLLHVPLLVHSPYSRQAGGRRLTEAATLTNFPAAVERVLEGKPATDAFLGDGEVYAAADYDSIATEIEEGNRGGIAEEYLSNLDLDAYLDPLRIVYEDTGDSTAKYVDWGGDTATIEIDTAQSATLVEETDAGRVSSAYQSFTRQDVKTSITEGFTAEAEERLNQLGYL
jgi:arylsulfatase